MIMHSNKDLKICCLIFIKGIQVTLNSHPSAAWAMHAKQQKMGVATGDAIAVNKCHIHSLKLM
jgi:hypothetical protein